MTDDDCREVGNDDENCKRDYLFAQHFNIKFEIMTKEIGGIQCQDLFQKVCSERLTFIESKFH